jgi:hypothetical protein
MASMIVTSADTIGPNRAGLVVVHGDGQVTRRCVEFSEDTITGLDLIRRAGLDLNLDESDPIGIAVCRLDSEGCTFPNEICFCQCQGSSCVYWSYWHLTAGTGWQYSNAGPAMRVLSNGDCDGWIWGESNSPGASAALPVRFDKICTPHGHAHSHRYRTAPTNTPRLPRRHPEPPGYRSRRRPGISTRG